VHYGSNIDHENNVIIWFIIGNKDVWLCSPCILRKFTPPTLHARL